MTMTPGESAKDKGTLFLELRELASFFHEEYTQAQVSSLHAFLSGFHCCCACAVYSSFARRSSKTWKLDWQRAKRIGTDLKELLKGTNRR
jgi:hypothetical protein